MASVMQYKLKSVYGRTGLAESFFRTKERVDPLAELVKRVKARGGDAAVRRLAQHARAATMPAHGNDVIRPDQAERPSDAADTGDGDRIRVESAPERPIRRVWASDQG